MATTPDYTILAAPRISREGFIRVLTAARSPAAPIAGEAYDAAVAAGVDPAVLLGVFRKESSYGRAGRAVRNRSWGNIKGAPSDSAGFRVYPDWLTGAKDTIRLLGIYGRNAIRPGTRTDTVQTMPAVWAPGPGADLYGDQLAQWIGEWAERYPPEPPPATSAPCGPAYLRAQTPRPAGAWGWAVAHAGSWDEWVRRSDGRWYLVKRTTGGFSAWIATPSIYTSTTGGRVTLARIISGAYAGRYIHAQSGLNPAVYQCPPGSV